jgi:hypothetical protein
VARDAARRGKRYSSRTDKAPRKVELKCRRAYELFGTLGYLDCGTELTRDISPGGARPRSSKKREPQSAANTKILPVELQVGDRLADTTGDWEVIAPPYTTAGGRIVHARVQRIGRPDSWEIRNWDASKRISVGRPSAEQGKG